MRNPKLRLAAVFLLLTTGCARVIIKPLDATKDADKQGVRYYAPQLYLLVTYAMPEAAPAPQTSDESTAVTKKVLEKGTLKVADQTDTKTTKTSSLTQAALPVATYKFFYLPDYSQGYRVKQSGFLGASELSVKLTDGWQLTELGAKSDSQLAATIEAVASLIPALGFKNDEPKDGLYKVNLKTDPISFTRVNSFPIK